MAIRAVRGMKDILPEQALHWQHLEQVFRQTVERYGFGEVRTPMLEATELFVKEIGEETDVVAKEMYSFERHGDALTVRPEGTASAARAYVQHSVWGREPISRWYYIGPMFRAERPAKGRYRQFHQAGCEIYGDAGPVCDAELIDMCASLVEGFGVRDYSIHINSIGSGETRARYRDALRQYFEPHREALSEDSQRRLVSNPLRILDSKAPQDKALTVDAPQVVELLAPDDKQHFDDLRRYLDALNVRYVVDPKLVRGLDYYTRTLFELKSTSGELGAQDALLGGGRYDNMIGNLGSKKPVPAIGFAMGIERILAVTEPAAKLAGPDCYFVPMVAAALPQVLALAKELRQRGLRCEVDGRGSSVKSMMRRANAMNSRLAVVIGEEELEAGQVAIKNLEERAPQSKCALNESVAVLVARLSEPPSPDAASSGSPENQG
jgi:histidyl-tRNA synthetase